MRKDLGGRGGMNSSDIKGPYTTFLKASSFLHAGPGVFGGQRESNLGGIVGLGGAAADAAIGNGYTVEMKFKCK